MRATIAVLAIVPAAVTLGEDKRSIERVFVKDSDVYAVYAESGDWKRLTSDGRRKQFVAMSPDGSRVAFVVDARTQALGTIVVLSAEGATLHEGVFRPEQTSAGAMTFIEQLDWLTRDRLVVSGSFNPQAAEYVTVDANTGREIHSYFVRGSAWKPSPGGAHVAYEYYVPQSESLSAKERRPRLCLDDECRFDGTGGYPPRDRHLEFEGDPVWSGDGAQVAIVAGDPGDNGRKVIVVRRVGGGVDELPAPEEAKGPVAVSWDGAELVLVSAKLRWKMNPDRSGFDLILK